MTIYDHTRYSDEEAREACNREINAKDSDTLDGKHASDLEFPIVAGDDIILAEANTERSVPDDTWTKVKEFGINKDGEYRIEYQIKSENSGVDTKAYAEIYRNGEAHPDGSVTSTNNEDYVTKNQDLDFSSGDSCEIWLRGNLDEFDYEHDGFLRSAKVMRRRYPHITVEQD